MDHQPDMDSANQAKQASQAMSHPDQDFETWWRYEKRRLRFFLFIIIVGGIIAVLTSCNSPSGPAVVLYKYHRPGYTYSTCVGTGRVVVPVVHTVPASFRVMLATKQDTLELGLSFLDWDTLQPGDTLYLP